MYVGVLFAKLPQELSEILSETYFKSLARLTIIKQ